MQLWCKKWFLVLAGIIVLVHNLTPHHHHEVTRVGTKLHHGQSGQVGKVSHHHHDDDDEEDESDGFALHHSIDHAFVPQNFLDFHIIGAFALALPPVFYFEISTPVIPYYRITPLPANESPPAVFTIRHLSYRGPPSC